MILRRAKKSSKKKTTALNDFGQQGGFLQNQPTLGTKAFRKKKG